MIKEYRNGKGKTCGTLGDDLIYRKVVDSRRHKLRIMDAYGVDEKIIEDLQSRGCHGILIKEQDTGKILAVQMDDFIAHSVVRNFEGMQRFLSMKYFDVKS